MPSNEQYDKLKTDIRTRIDFSAEQMQCNHVRWSEANRILRPEGDSTTAAQATKVNGQDVSYASGNGPKTINLPYAFATKNTINTYLHHIFFANRPTFPVLSSKPSERNSAAAMEKVLQHFTDHDNLGMKMWRVMDDGLTYGLGVLRVRWEVEQKIRTSVSIANTPDLQQTPAGPVGNAQPRPTLRRGIATTYEGPMTENVSPYAFFPDPRVPPSSAYKDAEYVFFAAYESKNWLKRMLETQDDWDLQGFKGDQKTDAEKVDSLKFVSKDFYLPYGNNRQSFDEINNHDLTDTLVLVEQGTMLVNPRDYGLGELNSESEQEENVPKEGNELWRFTLINKEYIVNVQKFDHDHGWHPCVVFEPFRSTYTFDSPSLLDYIAPLQDTMSELVNYRLEHIYKSLTPRFIINSETVDYGDIVNPANPDAPIRIFNNPYGSDISHNIQQLAVSDTTASAFQDLSFLQAITDATTGVDENRRGAVNPGGRKTATEIRTASEASASRLAAMSRLCSYQVFKPLAQMFSIDAQQHLSLEYEQRLLENKTFRSFEIAGDFNFKIFDGNLPPDKLGLLQSWVTAFQSILGNPIFAQQFDLSEMFRHVIQISGVEDLEAFAFDLSDPQDVQKMQIQLQLLFGAEGGQSADASQPQAGPSGRGSGGPANPPSPPNPGASVSGAQRSSPGNAR